MRYLLLALALLTGLVAPTFAADNPWIGTWKLDPSKSHFSGETITYSQSPNGMMHFSNGSTLSFDFGIDGKEYKTFADRTTAWTAAGENTWDTVARGGGKELSKSHRTLSADGKTLTVVTTGSKPDGSSFEDSETFTRVTGGTGLAGKWLSTKVTISAPESYIVSLKADGTMHWEIPAYKESVEGKLDGSDLAISGPTVPPGMTLSIKQDSPKKLSLTVKLKGKPMGYSTQTLASDSKSFTEISWDPGKMDEKATGFYAKQ